MSIIKLIPNSKLIAGSDTGSALVAIAKSNSAVSPIPLGKQAILVFIRAQPDNESLSPSESMIGFIPAAKAGPINISGEESIIIVFGKPNKSPVIVVNSSAKARLSHHGWFSKIALCDSYEPKIVLISYEPIDVLIINACAAWLEPKKRNNDIRVKCLNFKSMMLSSMFRDI